MKSIRGLHELNIELFRLNWVFMWNDCMLHKRRTQLKTQTELYYLLVNCTWASFTPNEWNANIEFIKWNAQATCNLSVELVVVCDESKIWLVRKM